MRRAAPEADGADGSGEAEAEAEVDPEEVRCNAALTLVAAVQGNRLSIEAAKKAGCVGALATLLAFGAESTPAYLCAMGLHALGYDHEKAQEAALGYDALEGGGRHSAEQANLAALRAVWLLKSEPQGWSPFPSNSRTLRRSLGMDGAEATGAPAAAPAALAPVPEAAPPAAAPPDSKAARREQRRAQHDAAHRQHHQWAGHADEE